MIHLPRVTGEVRSGFDVVVRNAPLPSSPRRMSRSGPSVDAAELAAVDVRDAVMLCQPFVDEGVVGGQQIDDAAILADHAVEQQLHLAAHRLPQRIVEVGIDHRQRADALHPAQVQPLPGEIDRQRLGARILQHAAHLPLQRGRILQLALARERQQLLVRTRAPEKERQTRGEFEIADAIELAGPGVRRLRLDAVDQPRVGQNPRQRHLDAVVEVAVLAPGLIELHQRLHVGRGCRMPERPRREAGHDLPGAGRFIRRASRPAGEDPAPARRVLRRDRIERSFDPQRARRAGRT